REEPVDVVVQAEERALPDARDVIGGVRPGEAPVEQRDLRIRERHQRTVGERGAPGEAAGRDAVERRQSGVRGGGHEGAQPGRITGTSVAGGVLRLRWQRTRPSIITMPTPGMSPSRTLSSRSLPDECWALSMKTKSAGRPGSTSPCDSCRMRAVLPVAKPKTISAGMSAREEISAMRR